MVTKAQKAKMEDARDQLRAILNPGDTIHTVLRNVSRSGMTRHIDAYVIRDDQPDWISRRVSTATGFKFSERWEAVEVGGCGMDMGFHLVYELSHALWPDGFECIGPFAYLRDDEVHQTNYPHLGTYGDVMGDESQMVKILLPHAETTDGHLNRYLLRDYKCPSNDHMNYRRGDGPPMPHPTHHTDGGYALRHQWM